MATLSEARVASILLPVISFAEVVGRGADIDDDLSTGISLGCGRPGLVPDVFADIDAHTDTRYYVHRALLSSLEVAVLVEDAVVGQIHLVVDADQLSIMDNAAAL